MKITVEFDSFEEFARLPHLLLGLTPPAAPSVAEAPAAETPSAKKPSKPRVSKPVEEPPPADGPSEADMRAVGRMGIKSLPRETMVEILGRFGCDSMSKLAAKDYAAFIEAVTGAISAASLEG